MNFESVTAVDHQAAIDWTRGEVHAGRLPVAILGISTSQGTQLLEAFGRDDGRDAMTSDSFALFSISKPLTGLAVMREVERGRLSLSAPLAQSIEGFGQRRSAQVELRHLLTHTSGLMEPPLDRPDFPASLRGSNYLFEAGTMVHYSSLAFAGIAAILETSSARSFDSHLEELQRDAGMPSLTFDASPNPFPLHGTEQSGLDYERMLSLNHPGAGLNATAGDMLKLGSTLLRAELLDDSPVIRRQTLTAMRQNQTQHLPCVEPGPGGIGKAFGLSWMLRTSGTNLLNRDFYGHDGWSGTQFWIYPTLDLCFVLLTNVIDAASNGVDFDRLHNAITFGAAKLRPLGAARM